MGEVTEPGSPPDATPQYVRPAAPQRTRGSRPPADPEADLAASLLNDLARTSLPTDGIPETSGHNAAAYAVSARRPRRAQEDIPPEPAVVVNMTVPFPLALPTPIPSRDEPTFVGPRPPSDPNDARFRKTMPAMRAPVPLGPHGLHGPHGSQHKTVLGPRAQRRQVLLGIMSVIGIATLVAIGILASRRASSAPPDTLIDGHLGAHGGVDGRRDGDDVHRHRHRRADAAAARAGRHGERDVAAARGRRAICASCSCGAAYRAGDGVVAASCRSREAGAEAGEHFRRT